MPELGPTPDGPIAFCTILGTVQQMSADAMRQMEAQLCNMDLKKEPGEMFRLSVTRLVI